MVKIIIVLVAIQFFICLFKTKHKSALTDIRIVQIGHGLAPRFFWGHRQLLPMTTY